MQFLAEFCSNLEENLVDTSSLTGGVASESEQNSGNGSNRAENLVQRAEAEVLLAKLKEEKPTRSMSELMMHPAIVMLRAKHLRHE